MTREEAKEFVDNESYLRRQLENIEYIKAFAGGADVLHLGLANPYPQFAAPTETYTISLYRKTTNED